MWKVIIFLFSLAEFYTSTNGTKRHVECGINGVEEDSISPNIFGGTDVKDPSRWPWMVSLRSTHSGMHKCGGTILNSNWILTAAHCVNEWDVKHARIEITLGSTDLRKDEPTRQVVGLKALKSHPGFRWSDPESVGHDIALLELDSPLVFNDYIRPACLPDASDVPFTDCFILGWGHQGFAEVGAGTTLREAEAWINTESECLEIWREWEIPHSEDFVTETLETGRQMCLDGIEDTAVCSGDSGSPFLCHQGGVNWVVAGVAAWRPTRSWDHPECQAKPFFYTNVTHYLDWIEQQCHECFI